MLRPSRMAYTHTEVRTAGPLVINRGAPTPPTPTSFVALVSPLNDYEFAGTPRISQPRSW